MEKIIIKGGHRLFGRVAVEGAKNAVLPLQAAGILASTGTLHLTNVPVLSDVIMMNELVKKCSCHHFDRHNMLLYCSKII